MDDLPQLLPDDSSSSSTSVDVLIVGAGPSGLLLASALANHRANLEGGITVGVVDPSLTSPWPNNYGVWMDEAHHFGYQDECDLVWSKVGVIFDEETPELILDRPYGRIDRKKLKGRLLKECVDSGNVKFGAVRAVGLDHYDDRRSAVTLKKRAPSSSSPNGDAGGGGGAGGEVTATVHATLVIDCSGFVRQFVEHDTPFDPGYQVTYGARVRVSSESGHPYDMDRMVLMDYSEKHLHDDVTLKKNNDRFPSFLYAQPISEDELFLEETVLVSRPAASSPDLQKRLLKRCEALGVTIEEVLEDERAAIPMGGMDPKVPQRTLGFGATASLVHPASGYMVARAMELAPRVAGAVVGKIAALKKKEGGAAAASGDGTEVGGEEAGDDVRFEKGALDQISAAGWEAIWPTDERRQRDFMHFGFELLCKLSPQELRDFFTGFFKLPLGLWEHFLSWRLTGIGHIYMGLLVWVQCIPRRFMAPMLIKSLPFLWSRLVGPAAGRGGYEKFITDSWYYDARTKDLDVWKPDSFYLYVNALQEQIMQKAKTKGDAAVEEEDERVAATTMTEGKKKNIQQDLDRTKERKESRDNDDEEIVFSNAATVAGGSTTTTTTLVNTTTFQS